MVISANILVSLLLSFGRFCHRVYQTGHFFMQLGRLSWTRINCMIICRQMHWQYFLTVVLIIIIIVYVIYIIIHLYSRVDCLLTLVVNNYICNKEVLSCLAPFIFIWESMFNHVVPLHDWAWRSTNIDMRLSMVFRSFRTQYSVDP